MPEANLNSEVVQPWSRKQVIWFGVIAFGFLVGTIFCLSLMSGCREHMKQDCDMQIRNIGMRCRMYAEEHNGQLPAKWSDLTWADLDGIENTTWDRQFRCPMSGHEVGNWKQVDLWADYRLIPGRTTNDPPDTILAIELLSNHKSGANVLFVDGSSQWWPAAKIIGEKPQVTNAP